MPDELNKKVTEPYEETPAPSEFDTREHMMDQGQCETLSADRGKGAEGQVRCDQSGRVGEQPEGEPGRRADMEGGPSAELKLKNLDKFKDDEQ